MNDEDKEHCPDCHIHGVMRRDLCALKNLHKEDCDDMERAIQTKLDAKLFFWVVSGAVFLFLIIGGAFWKSQEAMTQISTTQIHMTKTLDRMEKIMNPYKE
jgi:hypothetical protein